MSFLPIERKSVAASLRNLKVHAPSGVPAGVATAPAQMLSPAAVDTVVIVTSAFGSGFCGSTTKLPGFHAAATTMMAVTPMVLPRVQVGNFEGETVSASV